MGQGAKSSTFPSDSNRRPRSGPNRPLHIPGHRPSRTFRASDNSRTPLFRNNPSYFQSSPPPPSEFHHRMEATLTHPAAPIAPSHTELLGAFIELQGDLTALIARYSLGGLQLVAFLEDPAIKERLLTIEPILTRSTIIRYQTAAADALVRALKLTQDPIELRRSATILARITFQWAGLPSTRRAPRGSKPDSPSSHERPPATNPPDPHAAPTAPNSNVPDSTIPDFTSPGSDLVFTLLDSPIPIALDLSDLLPPHSPPRAPVQLTALAGLAPVARSSSP